MCQITLHFSRVTAQQHVAATSMNRSLVLMRECRLSSVGDAAHARHSRRASERSLGETLRLTLCRLISRFFFLLKAQLA